MRPLYLITAVALTLAAAPKHAQAADVASSPNVTPAPLAAAVTSPSAALPAPQTSTTPAVDPTPLLLAAPASATPEVAPANTEVDATHPRQQTAAVSAPTKSDVKSSEASKAAAHKDAEASAANQTSLPEAELLFPKPNQGHFIALGAYGVGAMAFDKGRGTRNPTLGQGFSLRFGEAVTDWLDLGLFFALGNTHGDAAEKLLLGRFGVHSQWYVNSRWFIQLGFGATNGQGADPEDLKKVRGRFGDVYLTGVGRHFYLSDSDQSGGWLLTPLATVEVGPDSRFTTTALWLGLEVSWWSGLSRDKLRLPVSKAYAPAHR